jgi:predicted 3-demethylubiquinone-9 3-methyltransferase (glyoxalase superfamily)
MSDELPKITTFLTFDGKAEEAVQFYTSVFPRSRVVTTTRYGDDGPGPKGSLMTALFELEGQKFVALNGGPSFTFSQGISLLVNCDTQEEIDRLWAKLTDGGKEIQCGWLVDKFGVTWQIVPRVFMQMLNSPDREASARFFRAMMTMVKFDIAKLKAAFEGKA